jgi:hypothetical protein
MNTEQKLDRLAELDAQKDLVQMDMDNLKQSVIPVEIKEKLDDINAEYSPKLEAISTERATLEAEIRNDVMVSGQSVKGEVYNASYVNGRTSWDTKALDGYAAVHPEILQFKTVGAPTVRISRK